MLKPSVSLITRFHIRYNYAKLWSHYWTFLSSPLNTTGPIALPEGVLLSITEKKNVSRII